jgi:hypothetical protein
MSELEPVDAGDNGFLQVRNWNRFQNADVFKKSDGRPPWIKLYQQLLDDPDIQAMTFADLGRLVTVWLWAARLGNKLPADETWWRRHFGRQGAATLRQLCHQTVLERWQPDNQTDTTTPANPTKPSRTVRESIATLSRQEEEEDKEDLDLGVNLRQNPPRANGNANSRHQRLETYVQTVAWQYEPPSLLEDLLAKGATPTEAEELMALATAIAQRKQGENARAS